MAEGRRPGSAYERLLWKKSPGYSEEILEFRIQRYLFAIITQKRTPKFHRPASVSD
jgi:hypothetical protein